MSTTQAKVEAVEFCARPFVRRLYQTLVVALAVFFVTLVAFKQDFRGYLAEARLTGPVMEGLDLEEAAAWIKTHDAQVAAVANRPSDMPGKAQLRITRTAMQPQIASVKVADLSERWLYQYLPDRLQAFRQSALAEVRSIASSARQQEDQARQQLESLRQMQFSQLQSFHMTEQAAPSPAGTQAAGDGPIQRQLAEIRRTLAGLTSQHTDEHPRIRRLQLEAAALEQQLGLLPGQALTPGPTLAAPQFVSHTAGGSRQAKSIADIAAKINVALADLARAASDRQTAEFCLSERMQDLASQATSVQWSKAGAVSITRLGGTPRCSTLTLAGLFALVAGIVSFRASRSELAECTLHSTTEVASSLELPVLADLAYLRGHKGTTGWQLLTAPRLRGVVRVAEVVVAVAAGACLLAIAFEPSLARQVLADPFGALSEVLGRFGV